MQFRIAALAAVVLLVSVQLVVVLGCWEMAEQGEHHQ